MPVKIWETMPNLPSKIKDAINNKDKQLVIFLGAGVSRLI